MKVFIGSVLGCVLIILGGCVLPIEDRGSLQQQSGVVEIKYVVDGDTVVLVDDQKIRLLGIDTPERDAFFYDEASKALRDILTAGDVSMRKDISETDRYGRLLRHLYVGDLWVNAYMIEEGYARMVTFPPDVEHVDTFRALQNDARASKKGLWQDRD